MSCFDHQKHHYRRNHHDNPTNLQPYNPDQVHPNDHDMVISISEFIGKTSNDLEYPHSSRYIAWMGRKTWDGCSHMDSPFVSFWKYFWPSSSSASQVQLLHENWHVRLSAAPKCISHFLMFSLYFHYLIHLFFLHLSRILNEATSIGLAMICLISTLGLFGAVVVSAEGKFERLNMLKLS